MSQIQSKGVGSGGGLVNSITATAPLTANGASGSAKTGAVTVALTTPLTVQYGGTGAASFTAYAVITAGTSSTGNFQNVSGVGTVGQVLGSAGAGALPVWKPVTKYTVTPVATGAAYVVLATDQYIAVDCSGGAVTLNFPNAPATGQYWIVKDSTGSAAVHNITVTTVGGAVTIDGQTSLTINAPFTAINLLFNGTSYEVF